MIQIEERPATRACSTCMLPLTWVYHYELERPVAYVPVPGLDRATVRIHTCDMKPERTWRNVQRESPEVARRGARRVRAVLAAKSKNASKERSA